jgi:hypothetical protein
MSRLILLSWPALIYVFNTRFDFVRDSIRPDNWRQGHQSTIWS